ncbi:hypothetical protein [Clostridium sp. HBUAS56017]|uniref:hypothetical protein n=1 Tax=Clostridium sp. HBUAS56017 TaxID=2571128 RepID=UPI00117898F1|nr:hypothetical protein [Clostridium sp. HBUAS56017]
MKTKDITLGGIMVALSIIVLYLTNIITINTFAILTVASCFIPITIIRSNIKTASFVYIASTIISFFILPTNRAIMYGIFFGVYGIVKYFIEKINKLPLEILLKLIFFNIVLVISLFFMSSLLGDLEIKLPMWALFLAGQVVFLIYDYAITVIISFYLEKFKRLK